jgi:methylthioribose-1-phosphate isomerase
MEKEVQALRYRPGCLSLLDQRRLPGEEVWLDLEDAGSVAEAIQNMVVRGAPAIAIAAAYGMALSIRAGSRVEARAELLASRPTAVNLRWALERLDPIPDPGVEAEAIAIHEEDRATCRALGEVGAGLVPPGGILTHCNTGALATGGWGTALGIVRSLRARGARVHVYATETRPVLQGARLTAWECAREGIPCTLLTDSMAGALLAAGRVNSVVVGCDRVAANGDLANKIGTLSLAVLARHHGIPFYVAMPTTTLDPRCPDGGAIPIEERPAEEVTSFSGVPVAAPGVEVWNPAFDITPASLITGWITENGPWSP